MKPVLYLLALFLLVFIGQFSERSDRTAADRNNDFMISPCAPYSSLAINHRNSGSADQNSVNIPTLSLHNGLKDTIQSDLSGKQFPLGIIVF